MNYGEFPTREDIAIVFGRANFPSDSPPSEFNIECVTREEHGFGFIIATGHCISWFGKRPHRVRYVMLCDQCKRSPLQNHHLVHRLIFPYTWSSLTCYNAAVRGKKPMSRQNVTNVGAHFLVSRHQVNQKLHQRDCVSFLNFRTCDQKDAY